jgi:hypothetical protein
MRVTSESSTPAQFFEVAYEGIVGIYAISLYAGAGDDATVMINGVPALGLSNGANAPRRASVTFAGRAGDVLSYVGPAGTEIYLVRLGDELTPED